jgi:AcrR family transcriptional regulator
MTTAANPDPVGDKPEPPAGVTPLTPRGARTRKALLVAARRVFERDGFLAARITDIAEEAGVAHGSFYSYFDSKEEAFREVFLDVEGTMLVPPSGSPTDRDPWSVIEAANRQYLEVYRDNYALMSNWEQVAAFDTSFRKLLWDWGNERFTDRIRRGIIRWQSQGLADPEVDPRYAAYALSNMVTRFAYIMFAIKEPELEFDQAVEQLTRLWANALGVKPGQAARRDDGEVSTKR